MVEEVDFEELGGRKALEKINKVFYDKVYAHSWLKKYFDEIPQQHIENQQVDFMQRVLGGKNIYAGKMPSQAHPHMFITEELFLVRQQLLNEAFVECRAHPQLVEKWLHIDETFKDRIVKKSPAECKVRYRSDSILNFPKPTV